MYTLTSPLSSIKGVGPQFLKLLEENNFSTVADLLFYLPLRYEDRSTFVTLSELSTELVTFQATVTSVSNYYKRGRSIQRARVKDNTGSADLVWFNTPYISKQLKKGHVYSFSGKLNPKGSVVHPSVEQIGGDTIHTGRLVPLYSTKLQIAQGRLRRLMKNCVDGLKESPSELDKLAQKTTPAYPPLATALTELHFPEDTERVIRARERLALEEIVALIRHSRALKKEWERDQAAQVIAVHGDSIPGSIPFKLTISQERVISEILADLSTKTPMNRLLTGDVGSGKTVVAGTAAYHTIHSGFNAALAAPTRLLAEQHAETIAKLFPDLPVQLVLGSRKKTWPETPFLAIGTHAAINALEKIKPALLIYDEQHRFGVGHRSQAKSLDSPPHLLTMTATPIPRSMILTLFSHLDISKITELPADRKPTKTWVLPETKRSDLYSWIEDQHETNETFLTLVVCPYIQASEEPNGVVDAETRFKELTKKFPHLEVALLHGKQNEKEKQALTQKLFAGKIDILVATTIVEVGIDLPQASVMIIESAQQYGLSSLHQLRGRVGRAGQQGYCYLFHNTKNEETLGRLQFFSNTTDGAAVAEYDLHRRGAGDLFGTKQHGFDTLKFASWTNTTLIADGNKLSNQLPENWQAHPQLAPKTTDKVLHN